MSEQQQQQQEPPHRQPETSGDNKPKSKTGWKEVEIKSYWWPQQSNIDLHYVEEGFDTLLIKNRPPVLLIPVASLVLYLLWEFFYLKELWFRFYELLVWIHTERSYIYTELCICSLLTTAAVWWLTKPKGVYLMNFSLWRGDPSFLCSQADFIRLTNSCDNFTVESKQFQERMCSRSGLGEETYLPSWLLSLPPNITMHNARKEAEMVMFSCMDELFAKSKLKPKDIDILIVNCSLFCPTPSLSSMIVNKYKLKTSIQTYNLGGMGCSAGVIAIDLAKDLLQIHKNCNVVVVSTENITLNWYTGNERSMQLQNALFRCGGAAILLTNKWWDSWRAKYQLLHTVRVHKGSSDVAYDSVYQDEDPAGKKGVRLSKELMNVVGDALKINMTVLGPLVLPWSEQFKFIWNQIYIRILRRLGKKSPPNYVPDFKKAFQHFCIHAGGRAIIDGLEENLKLTQRQVEPSRATLYTYGNTSSSSIWYELDYSEKSGYVKKGDKVWQIALGSGFKCNSAVWKALRNI